MDVHEIHLFLSKVMKNFIPYEGSVNQAHSIYMITLCYHLGITGIHMNLNFLISSPKLSNLHVAISNNLWIDFKIKISN